MALRVRLKLGESEIEVEGDKKFIEAQLKSFRETAATGTVTPRSLDLPGKIVAATRSVHTPSKAIAPSEYYRQKNPKGGTETLLVLGKFLEDCRSVSEFSRGDINKLAGEAKIRGVHAEYFRLGVKQGLLRLVGRGKYALTLSGEDAVAGMPSK